MKTVLICIETHWDMAMSTVRDKVSHAMTNDELDHVFDTDGFFMD